MVTDNTVLILDKEEELCQALKKYLARYGYDVIRPASNQSAFSAVSKLSPSIVISSINIENVSGLELLRKTREHFPEIQTIMLVENSELEAALEGLRLGASDYLNKPINSEALNIALQRAYERRETWFGSERCKKELEISRKNRALFQQLFDEVPCYISLQDANFRLTGANKHFKKDFGDHVGSFCYQIYKHRDEACRDCPVEATFEDGHSHQTEEVVTSQHGEQYNVLTWTAPLRDDDGQIAQVMEMSTNITQIRKLQSHLTSLGLLVGSMSHGIRGVLTALDGGLYRLENGLKSDNKPKIDDALEVVKTMVHRIRTMVLDILYYTKDRNLNWTRVNVLDFSNQISAMIKPKAEKSDIDYVFNLNCFEVFMEFDPGTVSSALINILENAIDACMDDKSDKKSHQVIFSVNEYKDHVVFETQDDGMGMDRQTRENLFTLFFSSKGNRGTGLGLFVANQIIEQHGGSIAVESTPGEGSRFRIKLFKDLPENIRKKQKDEGQR